MEGHPTSADPDSVLLALIELVTLSVPNTRPIALTCAFTLG